MNRELDVRMWTDSPGSEYCPGSGYCENVNGFWVWI